MNEVYKTYWTEGSAGADDRHRARSPPRRRSSRSAMVAVRRRRRPHRRPPERLDRRRPTRTATASRPATRCSCPASSAATASDNTAVKGDMTTQTKTVLDNGAAILKAAGFAYADVVSSRIFISDPARFAGHERGLPDLLSRRRRRRARRSRRASPRADYIVEITMVAVKDASRAAIDDAERGRHARRRRTPICQRGDSRRQPAVSSPARSATPRRTKATSRRRRPRRSRASAAR